MADRYYARSASNRTDDWPYWYVADRERGNLNVTVELRPEMLGYLPFLPRDMAEKLAANANDARRNSMESNGPTCRHGAPAGRERPREAAPVVLDHDKMRVE